MGYGLGNWLGRWLEAENSAYQPCIPVDFERRTRSMRLGDVLLVEGRARISSAIKYLTQSTWSHAALYVGDQVPGHEGGALVEVTLQEGCHVTGLEKYASHNTRICRASGLSERERLRVAQFMIGKVGLQYDLRNVIDLARFLMPAPPVPVRFRRHMLALGSGDPTKAICSSLIAQAFQSVGYPILPDIRSSKAHGTPYSRREVWHIRHHSLYAPRDFDLSPYFDVVKPLTSRGFDHTQIEWSTVGGSFPDRLAPETIPRPVPAGVLERLRRARVWPGTETRH